MSDLQCSREVLHIYESGREISTKTGIILSQEKFTTQQSPDLDSEESKVTKAKAELIWLKMKSKKIQIKELAHQPH
jgi:hypothetical protein